MLIKAITIGNFKGINDPIRIELKPITLLFGPNSAGKSTVVQALHYAREIFCRGNFNADTTIAGGKAINLGGFRTLVHNNDISQTITLRFDLDLADIDLGDYLTQEKHDSDSDESISTCENEVDERINKVQNAWVECVVNWDIEKDQAVVNTYRIGINDKNFAAITKPKSSFYPYKMTLFSHEILGDAILSQLFFNEEENLRDGYLYAKAHEPADEEWRIREYEQKLLDQYIEEKEENEIGVEELNSLPKFDGDEDVEIFLEQDSAMPNWDTDFEFEEPFWDVQYEPEDFLYRNILKALVKVPGMILREELGKMRYLGPMRELPSRNHQPSLSPDEALWANGIAAWDILYRAKDTFIEDLNKWLSYDDRLNLGYSVERKTYKELDTAGPVWHRLLSGKSLDEYTPLREELMSLPEKTRVFLRDWSSGIEVMPQDIGMGISQVIPVVVLALHNKSGIVSIEQPGLHVHPAVQVALGDLFISQIKEKEHTFLLETHSEHLMLRLLRRIRETNDGDLPPGKDPLHPDKLAVYFVEQDKSGVSLTQIRISEEGEFIDRWPRGFFSERMKELF